MLRRVDKSSQMSLYSLLLVIPLKLLSFPNLLQVTELRDYIKIAESNYRDVKVIETKLEHLEQVMHASKRIVQDQISQAQVMHKMELYCLYCPSGLKCPIPLS